MDTCLYPMLSDTLSIYLGLRLYLFICMLSHTLLIYLTYWLVFIQLVIHGVRRPAGGWSSFVCESCDLVANLYGVDPTPSF